MSVGKKRKRASNGPHVIIMAYGAVRLDAVKLAKCGFRVMVVDEAQTIKNHAAQISKACKQVGASCGARIALSGTVVENRLSELHSCFDFVLPKYLGKSRAFTDRFAKPIERNRDAEAVALLKRMTEPFMLRRLKTDKSIISDLPDKVESKLFVSLSSEQAALYKSVNDEIFKDIEGEPLAGSGANRSGLILKLLTALKQICNHPACYGENPGDVDPGRSAKVMALLELLDPIIANGEKVLIFSQYVVMCRMLERQIAQRFSVRPLIFEVRNACGSRLFF